MKKITFLLTFLMVLLALPAISWAQPYPPTAPDGYDLVEDATALQSGDVIIIRQASGNSYLKIDNSRTTDASAATAFVLEDAGTSTAGDFYLKAQGTTDYLKAAATNGTLAATSNISEAGVFNIKNASESGSTPETTISFANFLGTTEGQAYVVRLITTSTSDGTSRIWYNSNGWKYNTGGGHWTGMFAFKQQVIIPGQDINYSVRVVGISDETAGVVYGGTTYNNEGVITVTDVIDASSLTAVAISGYKATVSVSGTTITVTYADERFIVDLTDLYVTNMSVAPTTDPIVEGQWYMLTQVRNINNNNNDVETPAYDAGTGSTIKRAVAGVTANSLLVANTPADNVKQYLLRFIPTGIGNGYYIQFANGNFWNGVATTANLSSAGAYLVYNSYHSAVGYTGWSINATSDGTTYGQRVDNNGQGNNIAFWENGQVTNGGNNVWKLYPVKLGAPLSEVEFDVEITDGTNSKTFYGLSLVEGTTITASDFLAISGEYITSTTHKVSKTDEGQMITLQVSASEAMPVGADNYVWQSAVGNNPAYVHLDENGAVVNPNNYTIDLTKPITAEHVWQFEGDIINGYGIKNVSSSEYLGGRTEAGGAMSMEAMPSLFAPVYRNASSFLWKSADYDFWIDRSSGAPYAHTSGNANALTKVWLVTVSLSDPAAGIIIGGDTINNLSSCFISNLAEISLVSNEYSIADINGKATLAEALAEMTAGGTLTINVTQEMSNVTINVVKGTQTVKTVTVENVAAGRTVDVAEAIGDVLYVTGYEPATITATADDQTVNVTYTSSLPFTLVADPSSPDAPVYALTLRQFYAHGNIASSTSTYDITDEYLWAFGGDEFNGITVFNKANGYMSVGSETDKSDATFSSTPTLFTIKPNTNQTNGFNLNIPGTNAYINSRDSKVSTWLSANANGEVGSCLVAIPEATVLANLINKLETYFHVIDVVGALASKDTTAFRTSYDALKASPTKANYLSFKADLEANTIPLVPGAYYLIKSAYPNFYAQQGVEKVMYYSASANLFRWRTIDSYPEYQVMQVVDNASSGYVFYNPMAGVYLSSTSGAVTSDISAAKPFTLSSLGGAQFNIFLDGTSAPLHTAGHNNGSGADGTLTNWANGANTASAWYIVPQNIEEITLIAPEGVNDGEEVVQSFAHAADAQLPTTVTVYTISEELPKGARLNTISNGQIAAGQGYIIGGTKGQVVPLLPVGAAVEAPEGNILVAGDGSVVNGGFMLAYKKGQSEAKFWTIDGLTVPTDRSYLPAGTPTIGLESIFGGLGDDVTGINGITTGAENGAIYDLQGRRVNNAQKGVYIINGKKVIK